MCAASLAKRIKQGFKLLRLTRRHFRARQVSASEQTYFIKGQRICIRGPSHLSMVIEIVNDDIYGLRELREPVRTVVDVGANIGVCSVYAKLLFPNARVVAIEPGETAFRLLSWNVSNLNVELHACAVGAENGRGSLLVGDKLTTSKLSSDHRVGSQSCRIVTLASIIEDLNAPVDVLKLDCEGAEYDILESPGINAVRRIRGELHTCSKGNPQSGLRQIRAGGFVVNKWAPFADGAAGIVWADKRTR